MKKLPEKYVQNCNFLNVLNFHLLAIKLGKKSIYKDIGLYFLWRTYKSNWKNIDLKLSRISWLIREYIRYTVGICLCFWIFLLTNYFFDNQQSLSCIQFVRNPVNAMTMMRIKTYLASSEISLTLFLPKLLIDWHILTI